MRAGYRRVTASNVVTRRVVARDVAVARCGVTRGAVALVVVALEVGRRLSVRAPNAVPGRRAFDD